MCVADWVCYKIFTIFLMDGNSKLKVILEIIFTISSNKRLVNVIFYLLFGWRDDCPRRPNLWLCKLKNCIYSPPTNSSFLYQDRSLSTDPDTDTVAQQHQQQHNKTKLRVTLLL